MALAIDVFVGGGFTVLTFRGPLDSAAAPDLRIAAIEVLHRVSGQRHLLIIDGAGLDFLDSTGMGVLIGAHRRLSADRGSVLLANLTSVVARPVRLAGLDNVLPTHASDQPIYPWREPDATVLTVASALGLPIRDGWVAPSRAANSSGDGHGGR